MKVTINHVVDVETTQKATALRDRIAADLKADEDVTLVATSMAVDDLVFKLVGVIKGKPNKRWKCWVHAADAEEAEAKALEEDERRVIAAIEPA